MSTAATIRGQDAMDWSKIPTNPMDLLIWIVAGVIGALLFIPKWLKENKAESGIIDRLSRELADERQLRKEIEARSDRFAAERNELILQFSDMKRDSALVQQKLDQVLAQNEALAAQNAALVETNRHLSNKVDQLSQELQGLVNAGR